VNNRQEFGISLVLFSIFMILLFLYSSLVKTIDPIGTFIAFAIFILGIVILNWDILKTKVD
jgi:hypothetical protein